MSTWVSSVITRSWITRALAAIASSDATARGPAVAQAAQAASPIGASKARTERCMGVSREIRGGGGGVTCLRASRANRWLADQRSAQLFTIALQLRQSSLQFRHHRSVEPHQSQV